MDVFLAGTDSLKLTRLARRDPRLLLVPAGDVHLTRRPAPPDLRALRTCLPEIMSGFSPAAPLELDFFTRSSRSESRSLSSRALLATLPEDAFLEVLHSDGGPWADLGNETCRLFVESPGLNLVRMEQSLRMMVESGALSPNAALFRLLTFPMEACGSYVRDPADPAFGTCLFELEPIATPERILALLDEVSGIRGLRNARLAAGLSQSGSGSPEETLLSFAFKLATHLGGIESPAFLENEPIAWPREDLPFVEHVTMRPDFHWPGHRTAAEYNGRVHVSEAAFEEDQRRIRDYQSCGISAYPASYKNVRNIAALNSYLACVAHSLARREGPGYESHVRWALADEGSTHMRTVLLSQMLPAVPSEKPSW